jgi:flagellar biosynthesis/type III secretory pathway chaperone
MSPSTIDSLESILDQLIKLNQGLLDVCQAKQEAILDREPDELEILTGQQEAVTDRLDELNEQRQGIVRELVPEQEPPISLRTVTDRLDSDDAKRIDEKRFELKNVIRDVQRFSRENYRLLENRMTLFSELFERLEEEQSQETYDQDRMKDRESTGEAMLFDEAI